jgi:hypothetical protein
MVRDDKPIAYVYSHLVFAFKSSLPFTTHAMKGNYASYELDGNVINLIYEALDQVELLG